MSTISLDNTPFKKPKIFHISKITQNKNIELMTTIKNLTEENSQLKDALADLEKDLKEKDQSIEESQQIINKLKEEYAKLIKEFELMEKSYNELLEEVNQNTFGISETQKTKPEINVLSNAKDFNYHNKKLIYKQKAMMKKKIPSCGDVKIIHGKDNLKTNYNITSPNFKKKNINYNIIIKEKDLVIKQQNIKIKELNDTINKLNKNNNQINNNLFLDIFNNKKANCTFENIIKEEFCLPKNIKENIPKEFIFNMNFQTELIKTELFSSLIREYNFANFLKQISESINPSQLIKLNNHTLENKKRYLNIIKENHLLKRMNIILYKNLIELKDKLKINNVKMKKKCINLFEKLDIKFEKSNNIKKINEFKDKNKSGLLNINKNNIDLTKQEGKILHSQRILNLSTTEGNDMNNSNKYKKLSKVALIDNKINKNSKINKTVERVKRRIISDNYNEKDIFYINNSLDFNPIKTEGNKYQEKFNSIKTSYGNKTLTNNNFINYQKDILKLKKEFNKIISKSVLQDNLYYSVEEIPIKKSKIINKNTSNNYKKNLEEIHINEITIKRNDNIKYLKNEIENTSKPNNLYFTSNFFINLIFTINQGVFDKDDFTRFKQIYNLTSYENIFLAFKKTCNRLKNMTDEISLKINKSYYLTGTNFLNKSKNDSEIKELGGSFKVFNEKILNLKKLEFEFINMSEYIKNYLVSQEITIQLMYKAGKNNIEFEPIDKLFKLLEDCLSYRINEMNDNIKFNRKLLIKLFKNQINCLFLSFEYKFK